MATHPGPFFFAWADAAENVFGQEHIRIDLQVLSFEFTHSEGDFPALEITVLNPRVGLLAPGRKVWAWLSFNKNWTPDPPTQDSESEGDESESESEAGSVVPICFGRLVAIPENIDGEEVTLSFIGRPGDLEAQKAAVAATKKVRPYWDTIWFAPEELDDPDNILESRPELWHYDRKTLEVSTSNILAGEDGTLALGEADVFYDSVRVSYGDAPVRRVNMKAVVSWDQKATGVVDLSSKMNFGNGYSILTYTGAGLIESWPKSGASMGGGWEVAQGKVRRVDGIESPEWGYRGDGGILPLYQTFSRGDPAGLDPDLHDLFVPEWSRSSILLFAGEQSFPAHVFRVYRWQMQPTLKVRYNADRNKTETLSFTLEADVQSLLTEPGEEENVTLSLSSSEVTSRVDPDDKMPIGNIRARRYFSGPRGAQSIEYLIAVARAVLLARARAVFIEFSIPFTMAIDLDLSCRKSVVLTDARLPGGQAAGKIMAYTLRVDGDSGVMEADITIGCSIGKGNTVSAVTGNPTYVAEGYVNQGYQRYSDAFIMPIPGEVTYRSIEGLPPDDDGIDFARMTVNRVLLSVVKTGTFQEQEAAMGTTAPDPNTVFERLAAVPTTFEVNLRPISGGPFETDFPLVVSDLMVPKTIDLEAPSS